MTPIAAPALLPLVLPRTPAAPVFTRATRPPASSPAPRKADAPPASPASSAPAGAAVMDSTLRCDRAGERLDPADFAALIQVLETTGRFAPDPLNPPWADPRPDLVGDHAQWWVVLQAAHKLDGADPDGVFGVLWGIRCLGAQLELAGDQTRLVRGDEMSEADWLSYRNAYLMPRSGQIAQLLRPADAAKIAHKRPVPPARTPARFTGNTSAQTAAPRKSQPAPTSQSALPTIASAPAPAMFAGGDW